MTDDERLNRIVFQQFLDCPVTIGEIAREVIGHWVLRREANDYHLETDIRLEPPIVVLPRHVLFAVQQTIDGQIGSDILADWSNVIILFDGFEIASDLSVAAGDVLRESLHRLATPSVFGEITLDRLITLKEEMMAAL